VTETPFLFRASTNVGCVKQACGSPEQRVPVPNELGIRRRPPYNCRHTYATIRSMSGLNPAFIAQQLGHSVQMLLSTYARWINSSNDWRSLKSSRLVRNWSVAAKKPRKLLIGKLLDLHR